MNLQCSHVSALLILHLFEHVIAQGAQPSDKELVNFASMQMGEDVEDISALKASESEAEAEAQAFQEQFIMARGLLYQHMQVVSRSLGYLKTLVESYELVLDRNELKDKKSRAFRKWTSELAAPIRNVPRNSLMHTSACGLLLPLETTRSHSCGPQELDIWLQNMDESCRTTVRSYMQGSTGAHSHRVCHCWHTTQAQFHPHLPNCTISHIVNLTPCASDLAQGLIVAAERRKRHEELSLLLYSSTDGFATIEAARLKNTSCTEHAMVNLVNWQSQGTTVDELHDVIQEDISSSKDTYIPQRVCPKNLVHEDAVALGQRHVEFPNTSSIARLYRETVDMSQRTKYPLVSYRNPQEFHELGGLWFSDVVGSGVVGCSLDPFDFSRALRSVTRSGGRALCVLYNRSFGFVHFATSHDASSDPILSSLGWAIDARIATLAPMLSSRDADDEAIEWPEYNASVMAAFGFDSIMGFYTVYLSRPRCKPGKFMLVPFSPCQPCGQGNHSVRGAVAGHPCDQCAPGTMADQNGATVCLKCPLGRFQERIGSSYCKTCPENTTTLGYGSTGLKQCLCKKGYYDHFCSQSSNCTLGGRACAPCPAGAKCQGTRFPPTAAKKHFQVSSGAEPRFFRCTSAMRDNPCLGGYNNHCSAGYELISCSRCSRGHYRFGRDCLPCDETSLKVLWFYYLLLLIVFYSVRRVINGKLKTLYVFFSFLQVFGIQSSFRLNWTTNIKAFLRVIQVANIQIDLLLPTCDPELRFTTKFVGFLLAPWLFLVIDLVLIIAAASWRRVNEYRHLVSHRSHWEHAGHGPASTALPWTFRHAVSHAREWYAANWKIRTYMDLFLDFVAITIVNMRLMFLSIIGRTLDMLQCTPVGGGVARLSKDPNLICWEGEHQNFLPLVALSLIFYVVATPFVYLLVLVKGSRTGTLYTREHLARWGLLYGRFEHHCFFWELLIMMRRSCVVMIRVSLNNRLAYYQETGYYGNYQAALNCLVMLVSLALHFRYLPFKEFWLDIAETAFLFCTFCSSLIGICFSSAKGHEVQLLERLWFGNIILAFVVAALALLNDFENLHPRLRKTRARLTNPIVSLVGRLHQLLEAPGVQRDTDGEVNALGAAPDRSFDRDIADDDMKVDTADEAPDRSFGGDAANGEVDAADEAPGRSVAKDAAELIELDNADKASGRSFESTLLAEVDKDATDKLVAAAMQSEFNNADEALGRNAETDTDREVEVDEADKALGRSVTSDAGREIDLNEAGEAPRRSAEGNNNGEANNENAHDLAGASLYHNAATEANEATQTEKILAI